MSPATLSTDESAAVVELTAVVLPAVVPLLPQLLSFWVAIEEMIAACVMISLFESSLNAEVTISSIESDLKISSQKVQRGVKIEKGD